ncbi:DNA helicase II [Candidatus Uhrbacteria bacterium CG_4_10_14_0_2_um_filter_41_7]|uniref:DNA helicase II n=1 Tax=Candidatus Uhrbacteria bacterium CG_4_9_14_3_um_filter_41_35 TaxID=1975034 RepID=A0A2M7XG01_9BACT|nr:MAG: DNA helicase II [Candidatus Uhrbacteria bacterium CG_4_10_14_0_2_um_filter_41_7]PJA46791.1 MAG: DNA helicase II [Candidatus Uhrbacteria bacterium CG_4_9_14_3_um_filter_41_35]
MCNNKLIIAAAGSGKTTYLVNQAKSIKDQNVLITTYTEANEGEIRKKFNGRIPKNITIQTWFSFLLQHGVRPFQSSLNDELHNKKIGFFLTDKCSTKYKGSNGKTYSWAKGNNFYQYYFTSKEGLKICSDTIADFIVSSNEEMNSEVINRIARIYPYIFIDEVQDLAGWELEIIKLLFGSSSKILLVGDPRQVTYLTHHPTKYKKYKDGKVNDFISQECAKNICEIDAITLSKTHRNNQIICDFSAKLFPSFEKCEPCNCEKCRQGVDHEGVFLIKECDIESYIKQYPKVTILKEKEAVFPNWNYGKSKGLTFERVLIYPTKDIKKWIKDNTQQLAESTRCKFYVAITRAKYSVAIVYDYNDDEEFEGITKWKTE